MNEAEAQEILDNNTNKYGKDGAIAILQAVSLGRLTNAVRSISHGDVHGATGLEALGMAISGEGIRSTPGEALQRLASAAETIVERLDG